jgi:uracil-DNA glycosylase
MLWGSHAQAAGRQLDRNRHCVIETAHPSPLARGSGPCHRFVAAQPFRQANDWIAAHGLEPVDWSLHD